MENTKYKLDETDTIEHEGVTLYRIVALRDIGDMVKKDDRGGYVEGEFNLSHEGTAWVDDEAKVYGEARVSRNAQVFGKACVGGGTGLWGDCMVYGDAKINGDEWYGGDTQIWSESPNANLTEITTHDLLKELESRGGLPAALAKAALLHIRKSKDYNHNIAISEYFPFGVVSYAQMLHTKALRFVSLAQKELDGEVPNYEGLQDTALDIINYAGFYVVSITPSLEGE